MSKRVLMRVEKGAFVPFNQSSIDLLKERGLKIGDVIAMDFSKPRNPQFWRMAHQLGTMCVEHIEDFSGIDSHKALKKLQFDANIECEETDIELPGIGTFKARKPKSLAFESMDQTIFYRVMREMSAYIVRKYWPDLDEEKVLQMADCLVTE